MECDIDGFFLSSLFKRIFHHLQQNTCTNIKNVVLFQTGSKSLKTLPTIPVRSMDDFSPGDVIRFRYCGLPHEAVLVKIEQAENIRINVIHYNYAGIFGTREVVNEEMTFNLSDENMYIHDYGNVEVYEQEEVVQRAQSRVGEQKFNTFTNRSSHLAKWCKIKQNE